MIEIGLIGVPGSGKTQLANDLADLRDILEGDGESATDVTIVDRYAEAVEDRSGIALGKYASYMGNMMVAFERLELEEYARFSDLADFMVTCGTLVESSAYTAYAVSQGESDLMQMAKIQGSLGMIGCLMIDTFQYDLLFYLEPQEYDDFTYRLDQEIAKVLKAVNLEPVVLDQGINREGRLKEVIERLEEIKVDV